MSFRRRAYTLLPVWVALAGIAAMSVAAWWLNNL